MSKTQNLNLPITILHEIAEKNTQYKISGTLLSINEAAETAEVKFKNGRVENIALSEIYINEGFMDTLKKLGKKVAGWIVKKVKGFIAFLNPDGTANANSLMNPYNMAIAQSKGQFPKAVKMYPCAPVVEFCEANGVSVDAPNVDDMLNEQIDKEVNDANRFWSRIMKVVATTDKSIDESVNYVYDKYYKTSCLYESAVDYIKSKSLNEDVVWSLEAPKDELGQTDWGRQVGTKELKELLRRSIDEQLSLTLSHAMDKYDYSDDSEDDGLTPEERAMIQDYEEEERDVFVNNPKPNRPLCVYSAPGAGKTTLVRQILKEYRDDNRTRINLNIITAVCSVIEKGDMQLPTSVGTKEIGDDVHISQIMMAPQKWLPCYMKTGDPKKDAIAEDYFAKCMHLKEQKPGEAPTAMLDSRGEAYQGGVLFFDELSRLDAHAQSTMMGIVQREIGVMSLARSWAVCAASNRDIDDDIQDSAEAMTGNALVSRFDHVLFVPTIEEWLDWARSTNKSGRAKIAPEIVEFIEHIGKSVWYMAVMHGSVDREIDMALKKSGSDATSKDIKNTREWYDTIKDIDPNLNPLTGTKVVYNPRTWEDISNTYHKMLTDLLAFAPKGYDAKACFVKSKNRYNYPGFAAQELKASFAKLPREAWEYFAKTYLEHEELPKGTITPLMGLDLVRKALIKIVQLKTGSETSLPATEMEKYFKWQEMFNDASICDSIFNHGCLPAGEYNEKDEAGLSRNGGFEWKDDAMVMKEVIKYILTQYPGTASKDVAAYIAFAFDGLKKCLGAIKTVAHKSNSAQNETVINEIIGQSFDISLPLNEKELQNIFTLHTDRHGDIEILDMASFSPVVKQVLYNMIKKCDFIRYMVNYCMYLCKMCFTIDNFFILNWLTDDKTLLKTIINERLGINDQKLLQDMTLINKCLAGIKAENSANYPALKDMLVMDAYLLFKTILTNAKNMNHLATMGGNKKTKKAAK